MAGAVRMNGGHRLVVRGADPGFDNIDIHPGFVIGQLIQIACDAARHEPKERCQRFIRMKVDLS